MRNKQEKNTGRGRSRAQHVPDREADIERANNWRLVHLRRSKGEARRAEPTFGLRFRAKAPKETNGESRFSKGRSGALAVVLLCRKDDRVASRRAHFRGVCSKTPNLSSSHRVFPREPIRHTVVDCPISNHSFPANRTSTFPCAYA